MSNFEDLFSDDTLNSKMSFLDEKKKTGKDGLYRVDLSKVTDKSRGYIATVRFLPNLNQAGEIGSSAIEKVTHYVDTKQVPELAGYYDSPKNINPETGSPFSDKCALTECFWSLKNSKNAILQEKASMLNYSKKYFSYVLIVEDAQQRENEGKIMVYQYGKTIKDKINQERNGDISGVPCNVFSLQSGKDFRLIVKEVQDDKGNTFPDYRMCQFVNNPSSISLPTPEGMKNVPLNDEGKISPEHQGKIKDFLLNRGHDLEDFAPKALSEEQQSKVSEIIDYLTGRTSAKAAASEPETEDFTFDDVSESDNSTESSSDEDFDFNF
ncbi:MAG: ssDNA binding protein [uncultured marine phage]|uniref:Single-stranded DNA-binding protein n=1 Tax=uncultured marine phage TaxID=707152 RepID=A0A8D9C9R8_9VIRU|nr:MAG: ssDNA binding protein [uncultured marine phage]